MIKYGFTSSEVMKITSLTYMQVVYWDRIGLLKPSLKGASGTGSRRIYSFADIVGMKVAARLMKEGISTQKIRKSVAYLLKHFPDVEKPLNEFVFLTNGDSIFVVSDNSNACLDVLKNAGQFVFGIMLGTIITETQNKIIQIGQAEESAGHVFDVILEKLDDGRWHAYCPILKGCHTWGHTEVEAMMYIEDAVKLYVEDLIASGEPIPGVGTVKELKTIVRRQEKAA